MKKVTERARVAALRLVLFFISAENTDVAGVMQHHGRKRIIYFPFFLLQGSLAALTLLGWQEMLEELFYPNVSPSLLMK